MNPSRLTLTLAALTSLLPAAPARADGLRDNPCRADIQRHCPHLDSAAAELSDILACLKNHRDARSAACQAYIAGFTAERPNASPGGNNEKQARANTPWLREKFGLAAEPPAERRPLPRAKP